MAKSTVQILTSQPFVLPFSGLVTREIGRRHAAGIRPVCSSPGFRLRAALLAGRRLPTAADCRRAIAGIDRALGYRPFRSRAGRRAIGF